MIKSGIKEKLKQGQVVFGAFYKLNCPSLVEIFGHAGFEFIIIDNEHSNFSFSDMENLIRAADGVQLPTIVRVPDAGDDYLVHALDSGASGVQIPGLTTVEQVKAAVPFTKYYPLGKRGMNGAQRAADFGFMNANEYFQTANDNTLVVVHVENKEMAEQVEELCQVPGVDVLFAGPGDLSQSLGKPMQVDHPDVVAMVEKVIKTAVKNNKYAGVWVGNAADAEKYIKMGAQFIGFGNDVTMIVNAAKNQVKIYDQVRPQK